MENLIQITPNCYIVRTQAGFKKLCKKLHCKRQRGIAEDGEYYYNYKICQITGDKKAFEEEIHTLYDDNTGRPVIGKDGKEATWIYNRSVQYPIKYPCIISFQDDTFDAEMYKLYIKYINDELTIKDFKDYGEFCKPYDIYYN